MRSPAIWFSIDHTLIHKDHLKERLMELTKALIAKAIFHDLLSRFATSADDGMAIKAMRLCADDMKIGMGSADEEDLKPKGMLANALMMRSIAKHITKHHVAAPTIKSFSDDRIVGTAPIVSYRMDEGTPSFSVSEFYAEIVPDKENKGEWLIARLSMVPFANYINGKID
jgi:hypothetical protein